MAGRYGDYGTARQRDEVRGHNWGAAFFGWLVAVGIGALLTALLSAAGAAIALSELDERRRGARQQRDDRRRRRDRAARDRV